MDKLFSRYAGENPNGSLHDIGDLHFKENVLGMMPHQNEQ